MFRRLKTDNKRMTNDAANHVLLGITEKGIIYHVLGWLLKKKESFASRKTKNSYKGSSICSSLMVIGHHAEIIKTRTCYSEQRLLSTEYLDRLKKNLHQQILQHKKHFTCVREYPSTIVFTSPLHQPKWNKG